MRNKGTAGVLAFFLGGVGLHKFYLGKIGWGIVYLIFSFTFIPAFISVIEAIVLRSTSEKDFNKKYNQYEIPNS